MNDTQAFKCPDLPALFLKMRGLIGRKCWKVAFTYGNELTLHFGRHLAYPNRKMTGKKIGQWRLGTRGTAWILFTPEGCLSSQQTNEQSDEKSLENKLKILEGRKVSNVSISLPDSVLTIDFGKCFLFRVTPTRLDAKSGLPYWKLLMPGHQLITFGPSMHWTLRRSDVAPIPAQPKANRSFVNHQLSP